MHLMALLFQVPGYALYNHFSHTLPLDTTSYCVGFNDNIYHEGNISKMPDFDVFSLLDIKNVRDDRMVSAKIVILNENIKLF